jgi:hypothetical protein
MGAGQLEVFAQHLHQQGMGGDVNRSGFAVDLELNMHEFFSVLRVIEKPRRIISCQWQASSRENPAFYALTQNIPT